MPPARVVLPALAIGVGLSTATATAQQSTDRTLVLGEPRNITAKIDLALASDIAVGPDGAVFVADRRLNVLTKLSVDGNVVWQTGRSGQGPGEFGMLLRADVSREGEVIALDNRPQQISWFDADGSFIRRANLPVRMRVTESLVLLADGRVAVSGVASGVPRNAIRVYELDEEENQLRQVNAFGPLPISREPSALNYWGAGYVHDAGDGSLLFARKLPYEIYRYGASGETLEVFTGDYAFTLSPDDNVVETTNGNRVVLSLAPDFVAQPAGAHDLGDGLLLSVVLTDYGGQGVWDVAENGRIVATLPAPPGKAFVAAVDRTNKLIYASGEAEDGSSAYFQIPYSIGRAHDRP